MSQEHNQKVLESLEQYDKCRLECDGLTRVLSYLLTANDIEHEVKLGVIIDITTGNQFTPHFWIDLPDGRRIDYRARMWLGDHKHIPHGIFDPIQYPIKYSGNPKSFDNLDTIAPLLLALECPD